MLDFTRRNATASAFGSYFKCFFFQKEKCFVYFYYFSGDLNKREREKERGGGIRKLKRGCTVFRPN